MLMNIAYPSGQSKMSEQLPFHFGLMSHMSFYPDIRLNNHKIQYVQLPLVLLSLVYFHFISACTILAKNEAYALGLSPSSK